MADIDEKGKFYLGKEHDLEKGETVGPEVLYKSADLTTHGFCIGMTGSGKTGLCICVAEEAALQGIPIVAIDLKGDISNLLLAFPELDDASFARWVPPAEAAKKGMTIEEYGADRAELWRKGLAASGIDGVRIKRLHDTVEFRLYTPGSDAGLSINIMSSFRCPALDWETDGETLHDKIATTVSAVLGLIGFDPDPVKSTEHVFLSNVFEYRWREKKDITFEGLIHDVQNPPFDRLGALPTDEVFAEKDRKKLALAVNNMLASPTFKYWTAGDVGLDFDEINRVAVRGEIDSTARKPAVSVFYLAHLDDSERMFFIALLAQELVGWVRQQPGAADLSMLFYLDEIYGYLPSYPYNPPSKGPLTTLLKQGRAFGLGSLLTTQNPGDIDYKALTNCGTWFVGKLFTQRDKDKVLEGMEGLTLDDAGLSREWLDKAISTLDSRVFIMHNAHDDRPRVFHTRWAMSYLRGPLTRDEVRKLVAGETAETTEAKPANETPSVTAEAPAPAQAPTDVDQYYLKSQGNRGSFAPYIYAVADATYKLDVGRSDYTQPVVRIVEAGSSVVEPIWDNPAQGVDPADVVAGTPTSGLVSVSPAVADARAAEATRGVFGAYVEAEVPLVLLRNTKLGAVSSPGEGKEEFEVKCEELAEQLASEEVDKLRGKLGPKLTKLQEKIAKEEGDIAKAEGMKKGGTVEAVAPIAGGVIGLLFGGSSKRVSSKDIIRGIGRVSKEKGKKKKYEAEITSSRELIEKYSAQIDEMEAEIIERAADIDLKYLDYADDIEEYRIMPAAVEVTRFGVLWLATD
ncbi:MAG: ATP-binding protein [Candidatus Coatesbacteria bacterium]|nr:MAG: ATP-binding protein [Candidatus Coatesbacteria bacterium]